MTPEQIIKMAAAGNAAAEDFARSWYNHCRMMDDAYDKDSIVTDDRMAVCTISLMTELSGNKFYMEHKAMLYGVMVCSINAWLDSNRMMGTTRAVLAGMYHEVIYLVAFIVGGFTHLRHVTSECREYKTKEAPDGTLP